MSRLATEEMVYATERLMLRSEFLFGLPRKDYFALPMEIRQKLWGVPSPSKSEIDEILKPFRLNNER